MRRLHETQSLCPVCLRRLPAFYEEEDDGSVYLTRDCPEHGNFRVLIWPSRTEAPAIGSFEDWIVPKIPAYPEKPTTAVKNGCPYDCGLCASHAQHTCNALLELTMRCNLSCPLCYASSGMGTIPPDPSEAVILEELQRIRSVSGTCNIQLSGGEPTLVESLPAIIREAKVLGFPLVQVNSNGVRLGRESDYARKLADAGLDSVYLQWDSLKNETYAVIRGTAVPDLCAVKEQAVENCARAGLGVVFVATVVSGVNDMELGDLLRDAVSRGPVVRGLHLQPASYFGRSPWKVTEAGRFTLGHAMQALVSQAPEWVHGSDFRSSHCEHSLCSFNAVFSRTEDGLRSEADATVSCGCGSHANPVSAAEGSRIAKAFAARQWARPDAEKSGCCGIEAADAFSRFLQAKSADRRFTLSGMAFQDALSVDIERLRSCCIHIAHPDGRLVPFCCQNMTSISGVPLYPDRLLCR